MKLELTILGSNSATPAYGRFMTAQFLQMQDHQFLIDCAEGTQIRMQQCKIKAQRIRHVFISHLHGDHIFGLPGLLLSFSLNNRTEELCVHCPPGLKEMLEVLLRNTQSYLSYPLIFNEVDPAVSTRIFEDETLTIDTIPLLHRVPTQGFLFKAKSGPRKMLKDKIEAYNIPVLDISAIKYGADYVMPNGQVIPNAELTADPQAPVSYAFCSDTQYTETIIPFIEGVDILYHESTFMHDMLEHAQMTMHTTVLQAAEIAKKAKVGKLLLGHFSSRYSDLKPLLDEARSVFPNSELAVDGTIFTLS